MRVLHVTPFYAPAWAYGGMARASTGLSRALARRGHEVTVVTARWDRGAPCRETAEGVTVERLASRLGWALLPWPRRFARWLQDRREHFDLVHIHGHRNGFAALAARHREAKVPIVLQPHGTYPRHGQKVLAKRVFDRLFGDPVLRAADALLAVSQAEARDLPRPSLLVANGVDGPWREAPAAVEGPPSLLFVGGDSRQKRLAALPALLAGLPEVHLLLAGFRGRVPSRFGPARGRVEVLGTLDPDGLAAAYARARLLVHPAVNEAFGLVPFEAALCGTAGVVAGGHGSGEWYGAAGGCVVPPDDPAALAEAVKARLAAPERGRQEAAAVAEFARRELTWDQAAARLEPLYADLVRKRREAGRSMW